MGACASRFSVFRSAGDAPPPSPKEDEVVSTSREVNLEVKKDDEPAAPVPAEDDATKSPSLGHLLKENEKPKQEDVTEVKIEHVDAPVAKVETETKTSEEKKPSTDDEKPETPEIKIIEEHMPVAKVVAEEEKPAPVAENKKEEEKAVVVQTEKLEVLTEKKLEISETKKPEEPKPAAVTKTDTSLKVEDKQVLEKPVEKKADEKEKPVEKKADEKEKPVEKKADEKAVVKDTKTEIPAVKETKEEKLTSEVEKPKPAAEKK